MFLFQFNQHLHKYLTVFHVMSAKLYLNLNV